MVALIVADANSEEPIFIITRVAVHANVLMSQNFKLSSDFFGIAREKLHLFYGCPVMILQGAAGNLKPVQVEKIGGGNLDDLYRIASIFVNAVKQLKFELSGIEDIQMFSRKMTFVSDVPSKEEAEKIAADSTDESTQDWLKSCEDLRNKGIKFQSQLAEINFFKLNE
jgi:hypothetical protein